MRSAGQMKMVRRGQKSTPQEEIDLEAGDMEGNWRVPCSLQIQASDRDTVQVDGNFGREAQVLAISSQRVLTPEDTGTVAATCSLAGLGLQAGLTRQLHQNLRGEVLWVLGPPDDAGVTLNMLHTNENWSLSGKLQVSLNCTVAWPYPGSGFPVQLLPLTALRSLKQDCRGICVAQLDWAAIQSHRGRSLAPQPGLCHDSSSVAPANDILHVQLGAATALRGVAAYKVRAGTTLVSVANLGTTGIYAEAGVKQQWGDSVSSQVTVHHGLMGSSVKIRVTRAGHTVMVPVYVSDRYQDWQTLLVALTMPVVVNIVISRCALAMCRITMVAGCVAAPNGPARESGVQGGNNCERANDYRSVFNGNAHRCSVSCQHGMDV